MGSVSPVGRLSGSAGAAGRPRPGALDGLVPGFLDPPGPQVVEVGLPLLASLRRVVAKKQLESLVAGTKIVRDELTGAAE